jgi:hypothetical protein
MSQVDRYGRPVPPPLSRAEVLRLVLFVVAVLAVIAALFVVPAWGLRGVSFGCGIGCEAPVRS